MLSDFFRYEASNKFVALIDAAASRSGLDRARVFDDFLHMTICALSGGRMEQQYLQTVRPYTAGDSPDRAIDILPRGLAALVEAMEKTRADILGDVFEGAIARGQHGQFLTPESVCQLMAQMTADAGQGKNVYDPCCGSGRLLLAAADVNPKREFIGQDIDLRCVRITAINLTLRNLHGWVIHGNSLANERKLVYRTGFDGRGFAREVPVEQCQVPVPTAHEKPHSTSSDDIAADGAPSVQAKLFD